MKVRAIVVGDGTEESPYTVPLPTWTLIDIDYEKKVAIVEIPDGVFPIVEGVEMRRVADTKGKPHDILIPSQKLVEMWAQVEDEKYPKFAKERKVKDVLLGA